MRRTEILKEEIERLYQRKAILNAAIAFAEGALALHVIASGVEVSDWNNDSALHTVAVQLEDTEVLS